MELIKPIFMSFFVVMLASLKESTALECYKCGSMMKTDPACEDTFTCSGIPTVSCAASCTKIKGNRDGFQLVMRDCSTDKLDDKCIEEKRNGVTVSVCACNKDNCNSATAMRVSIATTFALVIGKLLYHFV